MTYTAVDPYSGAVGVSLPGITPEDLERTVSAAFETWSRWRREPADRTVVLERVAALHQERRDELAAIVVSEMGKPIRGALNEVDFSAEIYRYYARNAAALLAPEPIPIPGGVAEVRRCSLGPLLGIMPWNYPVYQVARFAAPNLALGNPLLLKHAPQCPATALAIEQIFVDAGLDPGGYTNVALELGQVAGVVADPRVRGVSLTGSDRAGSAVAELAGRHLKKVVLELGGSDPFIVLGADDLQASVRAAVEARLGNGGQSCNAAKRFIVVDELYDDFAAGFVAAMAAVEPGDPRDPATRLGPMASEDAARRLQDQVERAIAHGARVLLAPRPREGAMFWPVVLGEVSSENPAFAEEFFGPVAQLYRVRSEDEAIELANATAFGLGSYVFTPDAAQAARVADRLDVGMVYVNVVGAESPELPFGGVKRSGFGRELGAAGIEEFMNRKLVRVR
ncbi:NAD-dependent succinate-semialdehyde dehydrogenase [Acrocarpospora catenulata]|uniref:NAD-dependent succinate-semialdehyde dehydrogenase n=1 Tax=Acrocarpospora catenulata TaxID=2836182 RepID=UPI001BDB0A69|nr:NAD-dependent succinate-semialdehyde dehydrogenase [Acrocarpospora catenulata]